MNEQAIPVEQIATHEAAIPAESPAPIPSEAISEPANDFGSDRKKGAARRIKELMRGNKSLQRQNEALYSEKLALKESVTELRRQADESESLRAQIVVLEKREVEWELFAVETADSQAQAKKQQQVDAEQRRLEDVKRFERASNALIARSRPLAAQSDWDQVMRKGAGFFSPALLEEIMRCELPAEVAYWLASKPGACKELVNAPAGVVVRALLQIEAEIKKQIAMRQFLSLANGGR